jgi:hypothetical protein
MAAGAECVSFCGREFATGQTLATREGAETLARMLARLPTCPSISVRFHSGASAVCLCGPVAWLLVLDVVGADPNTPVDDVTREFDRLVDQSVLQLRGPIFDIFYRAADRDASLPSFVSDLSDLYEASEFADLSCFRCGRSTRELVFASSPPEMHQVPMLLDFDAGPEDYDVVVRLTMSSKRSLLLSGKGAAAFLRFVTGRGAHASREHVICAAQLLAFSQEPLREIGGKNVAAVAIALGAVAGPAVTYNIMME